MLGTGGLVEALVNPILLIYSGAPPATADAAPTGTLLSTISNNSTGTPLTFGTPVGGVLPKNPSQVWSGVNSAPGTAGYFRFVTGTDSGALSTTDVRIQGTCGTSAADLNMTSLALSAGAPQVIDACNLTLPTF
jgi:hypothetical protein